MELETIWSGTIDAARARAEQQHPTHTPMPRTCTRGRVIATLEQSGRPLTGADLCIAVHVSRSALNSALKRLIADGRVARSHRPRRGAMAPIEPTRFLLTEWQR